MLPLILLLLVQGLYAAEFPDLTPHISLTWNGIDIYSLDTSQTVSVNGKVSTFTICAPFIVQPEDVSCRIQYYTSQSSATSRSSSSGNTYGDAKFLYQGSNKTCMSYYNPISYNFIDIYNAVPSGQATYQITYICPTQPPSRFISVIFGVAFLIVIGCCAACGYCAHQNKKSKEIVQQNASPSYTNTADYYAGNGMNTNPGYTPNPYGAGNPPAYGSGNPAPYVPPAAYGTGNPGYAVGNSGYGAGNPGYGASNPGYGTNPGYVAGNLGYGAGNTGNITNPGSGAYQPPNGQYGRPL